jgi:hypothetical protein
MTIVTKPDCIQIELHGKEQFFALRAKVEVPREVITDIQFHEKFQTWRKWEVRMPGTGAPRLLLAGSYWTEEGWDFLYIKKPHGLIKPVADNVLVITTTQSRYTRLIVSCSSADAKRIIGWWKK